MKKIIFFLMVLYTIGCETYVVNPTGTIIDFDTDIDPIVFFQVTDSLKAKSGKFKLTNDVKKYIKNFSPFVAYDHSDYFYFKNPEEVYYIVLNPQGLSLKTIYELDDNYDIITGRDTLSVQEKNRIKKRFINDLVNVVVNEGKKMHLIDSTKVGVIYSFCSKPN